MNVNLIAFTQFVPDYRMSVGSHPDTLCGIAAAKCTKFNGEPVKALIGALQSNHESVIEHANFTFEINGISRVTLGQLVRHRLASYSVESQRYCGAPEALDVIRPESFEKHNFGGSVDVAMYTLQKLYDAMIADDVPEEDARYIMPDGLPTSLIFTANARELRHLFAMRTCHRAQAEIRELAEKMLAQCKKYAPELFADAGCGCVRGQCPEGKRSCGKSRRGEL